LWLEIKNNTRAVRNNSMTRTTNAIIIVAAILCSLQLARGESMPLENESIILHLMILVKIFLSKIRTSMN